jgi:hypothetical protein
MMRKYNKSIIIFLILLLMMTSISNQIPLQAAGKQDCTLPAIYDTNSQELIDQNNIPTSITTVKGTLKLNGNYLSNQCGLGKNAVVYGTPSNIPGNQFDEGQWRYLGYDLNGVVYRNWKFRSDSRATKHVAKNWVSQPWFEQVGIKKSLQDTPDITRDPEARKWLETMIDPYHESETFIQSYNKRTGKGWTGDSLKPYVIFQQVPTDFSPGIVQMWNIWQPDGSWWYEMFEIPPLNPLIIKEQPDLLIKTLISPADAGVDDSVPIKISTENKGQTSSGPFTVGIAGTNIKSEIIPNIPPGQVKTVTVNVSSATSGIKGFTAKTDFGEAVAESNEKNNTKDFKIAFNKKNEPTTPIAIISHLEGDHRTDAEITIKPAVDPKLNDKLSYSPGKEPITHYEWKYKTPNGNAINKKPLTNDFATLGKYLVELRVTNSKNKVSEWSKLIVNVSTTPPTPKPSATPTPSSTPNATPTSPSSPSPNPMDLAIRFEPDIIIAGEKSSLLNTSTGYDTFEWSFSPELEAVLPNKSNLEYEDVTYSTVGEYSVKFIGTNDRGSMSTTARLTVMDPKPVAIVSGVNRITEGRPFPFPFHLNDSYTPLEFRGKTIDHSKSEKRYKSIGGSSYISGFPPVNNLALGDYMLEGKVYDTTGRFSDWASLQLSVVPDMPPTVQITAPEESYRHNAFMLYVEAESSDGDTINDLLLEERYDSNGNGIFEEEPWTPLYNGAYKTTHTVTYTSVGQRQYRATVTEDYGKKGSSNLAKTDILNYAPKVNFNVFGITEQPGQGEDSAPPTTQFAPQSILRSWVLKNPYIGGNADKLAWLADSNVRTKNAVQANFNLQYPDAGAGLNSRNINSYASDTVAKPQWMLLGGGTNKTRYVPIVFGGKRIYTILNTNYDFSTSINTYTYYPRDVMTGNMIGPAFSIKEPVAYQETFIAMQKDEQLHVSWIENSQFRYQIINTSGITVQNNGFPILSDGRQQKLVLYKLTPDLQNVIIGIEFINTSDRLVETKYYKYSVENQQLLWVANGNSIPYKYGTFNDWNYNVTYGEEGTAYISGRVVTKLTTNGTRLNSGLISTTTPYYPELAPEVSPVSMSNDGQYLYVYTYVRDSSYRLAFVVNTYRSSDLVNVKSGWREYSNTVGEDEIPNRLVVMKNDQILAAGNRAEPLVLQKDGTQTMSPYDPNLFKNAVRVSQLPNGDLFSINRRYVPSGNDNPHSIYSLFNITKNVLISEGTLVTGQFNAFEEDSPILPDGSLYVFHQTNNSLVVLPFASASGKSGVNPVDPNTISVSGDEWGGLLYDEKAIKKNYALEFNVSVNDIKNDKTIGAGFQIQNERNLFSMEWSNSTLSMYRVVNGNKTLLQSTPLARSAFNTYPIKVESINGIQRVYLNHAKLLEVADGTYVKGSAGLMALGQSNAIFSSAKITNYGDMYTEQTYETVLVNEPLVYEKIFNDIDKDVGGAEEWSYSHNPNFFENPDAQSIYNGQTFPSTIIALDRAGLYEITFRGQDDPGLGSYRKWSQPVKKTIYVHRRPVSQPDVRFTGKVFAEGESLDYETYDTSYDPDIARFLSDKLFRTRWADESNWTTGRREYYNRPGVELIVQEQVRDIHGAWSYWEQTVVYKAGIPPVNQTKPVMTITYPSGTTAAAPTVLIKEPKITWNYYDAEGDPQASYRLAMTYVDNNEMALFVELEGNALQYQMLADTITRGRVVKVQGQVFSAGVWSNLSNVRYFVLDTPPTTFLLSHNGLDGDQPAYTNSNHPQLRTFVVDPENHPIAAIDYEVFRASRGAAVVDTNAETTVSSYTTAALEEGLHYWRARANDSFLWGPYSSNGFFFVDTVKPADVNEQLNIEPTAVTVSFNAFSDADPSSGHAARMFYLQKVNQDGSVTNMDLNNDGTKEYSIPLALDRQSYRVTGLVAGEQYRVAVLDYDIAGNEGHYSYIYFVTNRPPTANFDWSPMPIYEGDLTTFSSSAADPDGNTLSIAYELISPVGVKSSFSYTVNGPAYPARGPSLKLTTVGAWSMKLTVSDGVADPVSVTKLIQVLPLHVTGVVKHTDLWDERRVDHNLDKTGKPDSPRGYSVFWAGEKFVLEADTTNTGTATKAERVEVKLLSYSARLGKSNAAQTSWSGELWDHAFTELEQGRLSFQFTAYFTNGTIKEDIAEVSIDGNTLNTVGVHRVQ